MSGFRPGSARVSRLDDDGDPIGHPFAVDTVNMIMTMGQVDDEVIRLLAGGEVHEPR